ncbi:hypothetical protein ACFXAZ_08920 [Streptomyces sp. NPDC059477]|uniref:hypothetical protein n=1 Tax=Streptomyces sp. NPDC059477 TaxID=3346847 RepID=UPI0036C44DF8
MRLPVLALKEGGFRPTWRGTGTGTAHRINDTLFTARSEPFTTLTVNPAAGDGNVHALWRTWGHEDIGHSQPWRRHPCSPW